jgi:hypothetical protein
MTTTETTAFAIHALPSEALEFVRAKGVDASGIPVERIVADGGEPLRCCLRDARPREQLLLFGYQPPLPASPYREAGAVFAHAQPCTGPAEANEYPRDWRGRAQVLRAYDKRGWIHPTTRVHNGDDPDRVIAEILADADVVQIHSRNVAYGCYMFTITRADALSSAEAA